MRKNQQDKSDDEELFLPASTLAILNEFAQNKSIGANNPVMNVDPSVQAAGAYEGFADIFAGASDEESENAEEFIYDLEGVKFKLQVADNDGTIPTSLFACNIWNGSVQIAKHLANNQKLIRDKMVIEIGAGAAFPSIVALAFGARFTVITDYPNPKVLEGAEANLFRNSAVLGGPPSARAAVRGHAWGTPVGPLLALAAEKAAAAAAAGRNPPPGGGEGEGAEAPPGRGGEEGEEGEGTAAAAAGGFDVLVAAECLWLHDKHEVLLSSIHNFLRPGGLALISFAHHVPNCEQKDLHFFELARAEPFFFSVEHITTDSMKQLFSDKMTDQYLYYLRKDCSNTIIEDVVVGGATKNNEKQAKEEENKQETEKQK